MSKNSKKQKPVRSDPIPMATITINLFNNGTVSVAGFPEDYVQTMRVLTAAQDACMKFFFKGIMENRYDVEGKKKLSDILVVPENKLPI